MTHIEVEARRKQQYDKLSDFIHRFSALKVRGIPTEEKDWIVTAYNKLQNVRERPDLYEEFAVNPKAEKLSDLLKWGKHAMELGFVEKLFIKNNLQ